MDSETLRSELGLEHPWEARDDGLWCEDEGLDVSRMARLLTAAGARLITITARRRADGEYRLAYHWDAGGRQLNLVAATHAGHLPSIADACPAADWVEREIHDYFAVVFTGRPGLEPLMLRPGDRPGVFA